MVDFKVRVPITSQIGKKILTLVATKALTGCAMQPAVVYAAGYSGMQNVVNCQINHAVSNIWIIQNTWRKAAARPSLSLAASASWLKKASFRVSEASLFSFSRSIWKIILGLKFVSMQRETVIHLWKGGLGGEGNDAVLKRSCVQPVKGSLERCCRTRCCCSTGER